MKDYIQDPQVHCSYIKLRKLVIEAWNSISKDRIRELVSGDSIRARCQAVIDANGLYTKYRIICRIRPPPRIRPSHRIRPFPMVSLVVAIFY
jgi:hypothetical protein